MEPLVSAALCRLCGQHPAIKNSHVAPAFVFRAIRADSPTGFFRNPNNPNRRLQDGDKIPLLCRECEQRFSNSEREFSEKIFSAFHFTDQESFTYGPWLHYFMTSLAWRTLILDLPGLAADVKNPRSAIDALAAAAETTRKYLLGAANLADSLRNHALVWTIGYSRNPDLAAARPNVTIRRSVFGYTILDRRHGYAGVLYNLAGFMCFLIVKGNPRDTWDGTKVNPLGGQIGSGQRVRSWLFNELLGRIVKCAEQRKAMSKAQAKKLADAVRKNPGAASLRFHAWDSNMKAVD